MCGAKNDRPPNPRACGAPAAPGHPAIFLSVGSLLGLCWVFAGLEPSNPDSTRDPAKASEPSWAFLKEKEKNQQPNLEEQGEACANEVSPPSTPSATNCHTCMCLMLRCKMHLCTFDGRAIVTGLVSVRRGPDVCAPRSHTAARASWRWCPRTPGRDEVWGTSDSCLLNRPLHGHARACKRGSVMGG